MSKRWLAWAVVPWFSACGGGDSSSAPPPSPPVVTVPSSVTVTPPAQVGMAAPVQFSSSAAAQAGLTFGWDFGDGSHSAEATPSHAYDNFGKFDVKLQLSDASGGKVQSQLAVTVPPWPHLLSDQCVNGAAGGWCLTTRSTADVELSAVFPQPDLGYALAAGQLYRSSDRGKSWTAVGGWFPYGGSDMTVTADGALWIIADTGDAVRVTPGTWQRKVVPVPAPPPAPWPSTSLRVLNATTLLAVWSQGYDQAAVWGTWVSEDAGETWSRKISIGEWVRYTAPSRQLFTGATAAGEIWRLTATGAERSADAGKTFRATSPLPDACRIGWEVGGRRLEVVGSDTLFVVGRQAGSEPSYNRPQRLCISVDRGVTWTAPEALPVGATPQFAVDGTVFARTGTGYDGPGIILEPGASVWRPITGLTPNSGPFNFDFGVVDSLHLWGWHEPVMASIGKGYVVYSEDGGRSWSSQISPAPAPAWVQEQQGQRSIQDLGSGVLVKPGWAARRSDDGGKTWSAMTVHQAVNGPRITDGAFTDARHGFAFDDYAAAAPAAYVTSDGGQTWSAAADFPARYASFKLLHNDRKSLWVSYRDAVISKTRLTLSQDGGRSWKPAGSFDVNATAALHGQPGGPWVLALNTQLYKSSDDGQTWSAVDPVRFYAGPGVGAVRVVNASTWWVHSSNCLSGTTDGGRNWSPCESFSAAREDALLASAGDTVWYADGTKVYRRSGAAGAWEKLPDLPSYAGDIRFIDAQQGWALTSRNGILATRDGGRTWAMQVPTGGKRLSVIDANALFVVGGNVLATATGGQ